MKKLLPAIILATSTLAASGAWADTQPQGNLTIDRDGIKVWTYKESDNPVMNFRATTVLDSTLSGAVALVMDTDHTVEWAPYTGKALILDRDDQAGVFTLRMDLNFPFPLKNRDVVMTSRLNQAADGTVTIKNDVVADPRAPERKHFIRITRYSGLWQFKPVKSISGKPAVEVTVSGYADPNGMLPLSVINLFVQEQPFQMLRKMKSYVKASRYQQATVIGVKEVAQLTPSKGTS